MKHGQHVFRDLLQGLGQRAAVLPQLQADMPDAGRAHRVQLRDQAITPRAPAEAETLQRQVPEDSPGITG